MTTVYVVTVGQYSDYGIDRVYLDEAEATAYVDARNGMRDPESTYPWRVEEYEIGVTAEYDGPGFRAELRLTADEELAEEVTAVWLTGSYRRPFVTDDNPENMPYPEYLRKYPNPPSVLRLAVQGADREQVLKSLRDRAREIKAVAAGVA